MGLVLLACSPVFDKVVNNGHQGVFTYPRNALQLCANASVASASGFGLQLKKCGNWYVSREANMSTSNGPIFCWRIANTFGWIRIDFSLFCIPRLHAVMFFSPWRCSALQKFSSPPSNPLVKLVLHDHQ